MKKELEDKLTAEFSFMKKGKSLDEQMADGGIVDLYSAFGIECSDGWFDLLYNLCRDLQELYDSAGVPVEIKLAQVKEKYGTLRFYYDIVGNQPSIHAIDIMGLGSIRFDSTDSELHRQVRNIVRSYEEKSATVCEECGKPGHLRADLPWIQTLCEDCYKEKR